MQIKSLGSLSLDTLGRFLPKIEVISSIKSGTVGLSIGSKDGSKSCYNIEIKDTEVIRLKERNVRNLFY